MLCVVDSRNSVVVQKEGHMQRLRMTPCAEHRRCHIIRHMLPSKKTGTQVKAETVQDSAAVRVACTRLAGLESHFHSSRRARSPWLFTDAGPKLADAGRESTDAGGNLRYAYAPHCLTHPPALPRRFHWVLDRDHQGRQWQECEDCVAESTLATRN